MATDRGGSFNATPQHMLFEPLAGQRRHSWSDDDSRFEDFLSEPDVRQNPPRRCSKFLQKIMVVASFSIVFNQYLLLTFITPFFPRNLANYNASGNLTQNITLGGLSSGIVFAAGPAGTMAMGPLAPLLLRSCGTKVSTALGLIIASGSLILFGFVPSLCGGSGVWATVIFAGARFLYGAGASAAEASTVATITYQAQTENSAAMTRLLTAMDLIAGLGAVFGPSIGGVIYSAYPSAMQFYAVHLYMAGFSLLIALLALCSFENQKFLRHKRALHVGVIIDCKRIIAGLAMFVNLVTSYAITTTLQWWLVDDMGPFQFDYVWQVGLTVATAAVAYTVSVAPLGRLLDRCCVQTTRGLKVCSAVGLACGSVACLLISSCSAGIEFGAVTSSQSTNTTSCLAWLPPADNTTDNGTNLNVGAMTTLFVGLVLLGIGQTTALLPALPEMQAGISEFDGLKRDAVSTLWIMWYSAATVLGPFIGTSVRDAVGFGGLCSILSALCILLAIVELLAMIPSRLNPQPSEKQQNRSPISSFGSVTFAYDTVRASQDFSASRHAPSSSVRGSARFSHSSPPMQAYV